jgi:hypothetical protein
MSLAAALVGAAGLLFLGFLGLLAVALWRSPARLAETITRPLVHQLQELLVAFREDRDAQASTLADHDRQLQDHDRRLRRLEDPRSTDERPRDERVDRDRDRTGLLESLLDEQSLDRTE